MAGPFINTSGVSPYVMPFRRHQFQSRCRRLWELKEHEGSTLFCFCLHLNQTLTSKMNHHGHFRLIQIAFLLSFNFLNQEMPRLLTQKSQLICSNSPSFSFSILAIFRLLVAPWNSRVVSQFLRLKASRVREWTEGPRKVPLSLSKRCSILYQNHYR